MVGILEVLGMGVAGLAVVATAPKPVARSRAVVPVAPTPAPPAAAAQQSVAPTPLTPAAPPKPVFGHARRLSERQKAYEAKTSPAPAPTQEPEVAPAPESANDNHAFAEWMLSNVEFGSGSMPILAAAADYMQYCTAYGLPMMGGRGFTRALVRHAQMRQCSVDDDEVKSARLRC